MVGEVELLNELVDDGGDASGGDAAEVGKHDKELAPRHAAHKPVVLWAVPDVAFHVAELCSDALAFDKDLASSCCKFLGEHVERCGLRPRERGSATPPYQCVGLARKQNAGANANASASANTDNSDGQLWQLADEPRRYILNEHQAPPHPHAMEVRIRKRWWWWWWWDRSPCPRR